MINKEVELIIDKICRCCMCENENMHNIFDPETDGNNSNSPSLLEMLIACASIEVNAKDGLPNNLCEGCEGKLKTAYEFRTLCQKSDTALRDLTVTDSKKVSLNKEESIVVQPDVPNDLFNDNDLFDDEDDLPLVQRECKRKRGRPRKTGAQSYKCKICKKVFTSQKDLKVHLQTHIEDKIFDKVQQCLFCDVKYSRLNHLVRHITKHDKPGLKHSCGKCDKTFDAAVDLLRHSSEHVNSENSDDPVEKQVIKVESETDIKMEANEPANTVIETNTEPPDHNDTLVNSTASFDDFPFSDIDDHADSDDGDFFAEYEEKKENKKKPKRNGKDSDTLYECKECPRVLTTYMGLKIHMRRHTGSYLIKCEVCNKSFSKTSHLIKHSHIHGLNDKLKGDTKSEGKTKVEIPCEYCDRKFKYRKSFRQHVRVEHGISDVESDIGKPTENHRKPENATSNEESFEDLQNEADGELPTGDNLDLDQQFVEVDGDSIVKLQVDTSNMKKMRAKNQVCHVCAASFDRVNHLTRHMTLHRSVLVHQCDRCEKAFATEGHLKAHIEDEHINKPYICTVCNKQFSRGEHLIRHLKVHQSNPDKEESLKCSICDSVFTRSDHLARHTKIHLLQDKRHVCVDCGKAFNRLDNLRTHQRIHTGVKDTSKLHLCIYCGKEFNNSSNMIVHMRRHTGERPYKCTECGKGFPRSHDLKCHERTHSGEKPYLCTLCGKSFNKSNKLLRHSRVHTGERPYVCNICGRAFTQSNDLALHMRRHTGARPYACGVCPARFIQSGQLKNHRRASGHWMETQPDLKGGHRVEPVTPAHEPMPIRFKSHKAKSKEEPMEPVKPAITPIADTQSSLVEQSVSVEEIQTQPQRILMGIMGNIKLQSDSLLIDSTKLVELHTGLVNLPTVIQTANGEEIKLKSEVQNFNITQVEEVDKDDVSGGFQDATVIYSNVGHTSTTFTTSENFNFQNYQ